MAFDSDRFPPVIKLAGCFCALKLHVGAGNCFATERIAMASASDVISKTVATVVSRLAKEARHVSHHSRSA